MKKILVSEVWNLGDCRHETLEFVNVALNRDNMLFIDPCMIEAWDDEWAIRAKRTMESFFEKFYQAYRNNDSLLKYTLLSHAREQNATRLGYGKGDNGKGNTAQGLLKDFRPLETLIHEIDTIGIPQDITVLIPGFAEDGFSDLLTNILHAELNEFTLKQMRKYNIKPNGTTTFFTWNADVQNWIEVNTECYYFGKDEVLLVPKQIVRKNYLFGVGQYFERIILERVREEDEWYTEDHKPIPKRDIAKQLRTEEEHWQYDYAINYTKEHCDALLEYHKKLKSYYIEFGQPIDDEILDDLLLKIEIASA